MSSGCRSSVGSVDAPARATYVSLYSWPESDAEFARSVAAGGGGASRAGRCGSRRRRWGPGFGPEVVDSYSCRQMYLRSYTFTTKKESVPERTRQCLGRLKDRAALLLPPRKTEGVTGGGGGCPRRKKRRNQWKEGCMVVVRKLRKESRSTMSSIFHRLLSWTTSADAVDRRRSPHS